MVLSRGDQGCEDLDVQSQWARKARDLAWAGWNSISFIHSLAIYRAGRILRCVIKHLGFCPSWKLWGWIGKTEEPDGFMSNSLSIPSNDPIFCSISYSDRVLHPASIILTCYSPWKGTGTDFLFNYGSIHSNRRTASHLSPLLCAVGCFTTCRTIQYLPTKPSSACGRAFRHIRSAWEVEGSVRPTPNPVIISVTGLWLWYGCYLLKCHSP